VADPQAITCECFDGIKRRKAIQLMVQLK